MKFELGGNGSHKIRRCLSSNLVAEFAQLSAAQIRSGRAVVYQKCFIIIVVSASLVREMLEGCHMQVCTEIVRAMVESRVRQVFNVGHRPLSSFRTAQNTSGEGYSMGRWNTLCDRSRGSCRDRVRKQKQRTLDKRGAQRSNTKQCTQSMIEVRTSCLSRTLGEA